MPDELRDLFKQGLDEIPIYRRTRATTARAHTPISTPIRWALPGITTALVLIASLLIAEIVSDIRSLVASEPRTPVAGLPALQAGTDLVYLGEADLGRGGVQIVRMPDGTVGRLVGRGIVGSQSARYRMLPGRDIAFLQVWRDGGYPPGVAQTYLQAVTLDAGAPGYLRIDIGLVSTGDAGGTNVRVPGPHSGEAAVDSDQARVFEVRDEGPNGGTTRLSVFDIRKNPLMTGKLIASRTWSTDPNGSFWARVIPLDTDHVALVRQEVAGPDIVGRATVGRQEWYFLDSDLNSVISFPSVSAFGAAACTFDFIRTPEGEWALLCLGPGDSPVVTFLDQHDFHVISTVAVGLPVGAPLGAVTTPDGYLAILTSEPGVVRVNTRTHSLNDARPIQSTGNALRPVADPNPTAGPIAQFTADGRYAYLADALSSGRMGVAAVDLTGAALVARSPDVDEVIAIKFSQHDERLYVLSRLGTEVRLALVDPSTLRVVSESPILSNTPQAIFAIAAQR